MRVLMFGWEFPPFVAGGLATATVGLVKGLLKNGVDVTLVVPFSAARSPLEVLRLVGAGEAAERGGLSLQRIPTPTEPYGNEEQYGRTLAGLERAQPGVTASSEAWPRRSVRTTVSLPVSVKRTVP